MEASKSTMKITTEEWLDKQRRGMATFIENRPYIVTLHEATQEPVYHAVVLHDSEPPDRRT